MNPGDIPGRIPADDAGEHVYGEPYQTPDGATVITVARVRGGGTGQGAGGRGAAGFSASPVGVFVIRGGDARWVPVVSRVAVIGVTAGLAAAVLAGAALLRRPPWPDLKISVQPSGREP